MSETNRFHKWQASALWTNRNWSWVCLVYLILTLFHPPHGLPFRLCLFHWMYGVDCPACGMTRGLSHLWHGEIRSSLISHPFAWLVFIYLVFQSSELILPRKIRQGLVSLLDRFNLFFLILTVILAGLFFGYGVIRSAWQAWNLFLEAYFG